MNSIMQSIKPQYCELIAAGRKTYEVRKTRPKIETPFKVYIYQSKTVYVSKNKDNEILKTILDKRLGKVIGEYICDEITEYTTEFHPADDLFQGIWKTVFDEDADDTYGEIVTSNDFDNPDDCDICKKSCLTFNDIKKYVGYGDKKFYAYHISSLKIYDEPKELSEFFKACNKPKGTDCSKCIDNREQSCKPLTRPPQSWCYCEEV